jgi:hypothetical protein
VQFASSLPSGQSARLSHSCVVLMHHVSLIVRQAHWSTSHQAEDKAEADNDDTFPAMPKVQLSSSLPSWQSVMPSHTSLRSMQ